MDLTFSTDFLVGNKTVPVLILNDDGEVLYHVNVPPPPLGSDREAYFDSVWVHQMGTNPPIRFEEVGQTIYYSESVRLRELREAMSELIESFISETVINSASVPVMLLDSTATRIVNLRASTSRLSDPEVLQERLMAMAVTTHPSRCICLGRVELVFYEESLVLTQLKFFPAVQLLLIAAFLLVAYLVFSASRRAEQNRVWSAWRRKRRTSWAPLSSLMAWSSLLSARGVDPERCRRWTRTSPAFKWWPSGFPRLAPRPT